MNNELKIGDIVELKSGSPKMTVTDEINDELECTWMTNDGNKKRDYFKKDSLKKVKEN